MMIQMNEDKIIDLTKGNIYKRMLLYFLPILAGTFFQQLYNTVDAIVVGRFVGKDALGCVAGTSGMITQLILGFFIGLSSGAAVIVSQSKGAHDEENVRKSIHGIYFISIIGSLAVMFSCLWFIPFLLKAMGTPQELMAGSSLYLRFYFAGTLFIFIFNAGSAALRALGDSKHPLYYLIVCSVINVILDFRPQLVIRPPGRGSGFRTQRKGKNQAQQPRNQLHNPFTLLYFLCRARYGSAPLLYLLLSRQSSNLNSLCELVIFRK